MLSRISIFNACSLFNIHISLKTAKKFENYNNIVVMERGDTELFVKLVPKVL